MAIKQYLFRHVRLIRQRVGLFEGKTLFLTLRKRFVTEWSALLATDAQTFSGLFAPLVLVRERKSQKPWKTLEEWYNRTRYKWECDEITIMSEKALKPVIERANAAECAIWADLLLAAAEKAGIYREKTDTLKLDETNVAAYAEWNGEELYVDDVVKIMHPAWYQNGTVLEGGHCVLANGSDNPNDSR